VSEGKCIRGRRGESRVIEVGGYITLAVFSFPSLDELRGALRNPAQYSPETDPVFGRVDEPAREYVLDYPDSDPQGRPLWGTVQVALLAAQPQEHIDLLDPRTLAIVGAVGGGL
jgi:hypothetical protein